ncbi:anaerobic ribonucleoside-triphosphate reductase activating protein [Neobacillus sp. 3P2-tot-E-2]|uniref:anaerobic ribonucleoside-triphosphate reductase activating protein n=1 Tax=Neobacillus sp. 3P2-tot-E-2 TaxID=3132212 RepID=UPI00399FB43C
MRILNILHDSIVDGVGLRTVIFFAGCPHHCNGCQNPDSWNYSNGNEWTETEVFVEILQNELSDVTFSGGEPFLQAKEIAPLANKLKQEGKNIWCYTGYLYEELLKNHDHAALLEHIDVLVDGRFNLTKRDLSLCYKGSSNQRIINVPKSLENKQGDLILEFH